jgi:O-antigen/teichoic acid export membrane protein
MNGLAPRTRPRERPLPEQRRAPAAEARQGPPRPGRILRDSVIVSIGGQIERLLGIVTALLLRWGLDPPRLGVYGGLRVYLDQTNRSSLGIGQGAVQEIPILLASGRADEARRVADVAHTANTFTSTLYAVGLLIWAAVRAPLVAGDPLAGEWTWGLVAVAGLTLLQRRLSFHVAVLRAHGAFALTTELDVFEAGATLALVAVGLWLAGFWGLIAAVGLVLASKLAYLHARHPLRFHWAWDPVLLGKLFRVGLPVFVCTSAFGIATNLDRVLLLWLWPGPLAARGAGLYSVAALGAGWGLDLAGRVALVLYNEFQTTLGRTGDRREVALQAIRAIEVQAPLLGLGAAASCVLGPPLLGAILPRYAEGLSALAPLAPGMTLLALSWPSRQALIAVGQPYRLGLATLLGAVFVALSATTGALRGDLSGIAWGTSLGYAALYLATSFAAFGSTLGWQAFVGHQGRVLRSLGWYALGTKVAIETGHPALGIGVLVLWATPDIARMRPRAGRLDPERGAAHDA